MGGFSCFCTARGGGAALALSNNSSRYALGALLSLTLLLLAAWPASAVVLRFRFRVEEPRRVCWPPRLWRPVLGRLGLRGGVEEGGGAREERLLL